MWWFDKVKKIPSHVTSFLSLQLKTPCTNREMEKSGVKWFSYILEKGKKYIFNVRQSEWFFFSLISDCQDMGEQKQKWHILIALG